MSDKLGYYDLVHVYGPFFVVIFVIIATTLLYNYLERSSYEKPDWEESWDNNESK